MDPAGSRKIDIPRHHCIVTLSLEAACYNALCGKPDEGELPARSGAPQFELFTRSRRTVSLELVSVIIPVFNGERHLAKTLQSVLRQTYDQIEVVIVDDGSTDRSCAVAEAAAQADKRIRLLTNPGKGVAAARNHGIANAAGPLIAPLDADDLWHPAKVARQVERMTHCTPETGVVYCCSVEIDELDRVIDVGPIEEMPEGKTLPKLVERNFLGNASTPLIRRSFLDAFDGYDPGMRDAQAQGTEDWKLYLRLAEICEFAVVPELLVGYRKSESSMSADVSGMARSC